MRLGTQAFQRSWGRGLALENRACAELGTLSGSEDPVALGPVINGLSDFQNKYSHLSGLLFTHIQGK